MPRARADERATAERAPISVSFEFFPPADAAMEATLWRSLERLAPLAPRFVSVTYGADGSTRERTHNVVTRIQRRTTLTGAPHLTCIGASRGEILDIARSYWDEGIRHLVALRGDPPQGQGAYRPHAAGFAYACELVAGLAALAPFDISVAAYPEVHPEAPRRRRISTISGARSMRAPRAPSPSSSTTPRCTCAFATAARRPAFTHRSCPASCRSHASRRCCASRAPAAPASRAGCTSASRAWTRTRRRAA